MFYPQWLLLGAVVVALLVWNLWRRLASDRIVRLNDRRRDSCRLVSRGELVDGSRHVPVALALSENAFYYENADIHASLDLEWVQEVEYDNELLTGHAVGVGQVLRLRCFSRAFEFVLDPRVVQEWRAVLPPVRLAQ